MSDFGDMPPLEAVPSGATRLAYTLVPRHRADPEGERLFRDFLTRGGRPRTQPQVPERTQPTARSAGFFLPSQDEPAEAPMDCDIAPDVRDEGSHIFALDEPTF